MQIYSAARLEKDYSAVAAQCARTGEAQILAENGRADLVVMDAKDRKSTASDRIALEMGVVAAG